MGPRDGKYGSFTNEDLNAGSTNINSRLVNPFIGLRPEDMFRLIDEFMAKTGIEDLYLELIKKGAFLAQDPRAFDARRDDLNLYLKPDEEEILRLEDPKVGNKWNQKWTLYALVGCCSLGAAVQGWDETAVNGAQVFYKRAFNLLDNKNDPAILGLINSAPYLCCAVLGCWLTEPLNRLLGRRGTIFVTCIISSLSCLWQAFTSTWWHLFIARFFLGLGIGPKSSTIPIYSAECVPANIRGGLVMMWQMWTAFGIMLGYIAGVIFRNVLDGDSVACTAINTPQSVLLSTRCSLNWRLMLASPMVLPLIAAAYVYTLPESPRWLLLKARQGQKSKYKKAFDALCRLRHHKIQAARDLFLIQHLLDGEDDIRQKRGNRFFELWTIPRNRRAITGSIIVMFMQQFCGVNVLAFYSSEVLAPVLGDKRALLASMGFGILNFVFALPAVYTIDRLGRRFLLLSTYPFLALFQLLTGMAFLLPNGSAGQTATVLTGMYLFSVFYSPGQGPVAFVYSAESMPLYLRDLGMLQFPTVPPSWTCHCPRMSCATATLWAFNFLLAVTFPRFQQSFTNPGAFGYYAAWCVMGWFLILLFVPETKDLTLEQLDVRFSIPTKDHARFALKEIRYLFRRYLGMQKHEVRPVLHVRIEDPTGFQMQGYQRRKIPAEHTRQATAIDV